MRRPLLALALLLAACPRPAPSTTTPASAPTGSERAAAVAAVSAELARDLGLPAVVAGPEVNLEGDFAFVLGQISAPDGGDVNLAATHYKAQFEEGAFEDMVVALVHREGAAWKILEYAAGCTDVCWLGWAEKHGSPVGGMPDTE